MPGILTDLSFRLAAQAEAVCRHYLSNGRRSGRYWTVGDAMNTPGRSLWVRLTGPARGRGAAGRWVDAATGEHGDLVDLIRINQGLIGTQDLIAEARRFLALPHSDQPRRPGTWARGGMPEAARRLWASSRPLAGTPAERYLLARGIIRAAHTNSLRFHPHCYYRGDPGDARDHIREAWPALIAAVHDGAGNLTGIQRTWLDPDTSMKAPISSPRRAMGHLLGGGVRFGDPGPVMATGEGFETVLSLREVMPAMPMVAALSSANLAALLLPRALQRLYIVRDNDPAGHWAARTIADRARARGIAVRVISPRLADLNDDLLAFGRNDMIAHMRDALSPEDARFLLVQHSA